MMRMEDSGSAAADAAAMCSAVVHWQQVMGRPEEDCDLIVICGCNMEVDMP